MRTWTTAVALIFAWSAFAASVDFESKLKSDRMLCARARAGARVCCEHPELCVRAAPLDTSKTAGLNGTCQAYRDAADQSLSVNELGASRCSRFHNRCQSTCGDLEEVYKKGTDDDSKAAVMYFREQVVACREYREVVDILLEEAENLRADSLLGSNCQTQASGSPNPAANTPGNTDPKNVPQQNGAFTSAPGRYERSPQSPKSIAPSKPVLGQIRFAEASKSRGKFNPQFSGAADSAKSPLTPAPPGKAEVIPNRNSSPPTPAAAVAPEKTQDIALASPPKRRPGEGMDIDRGFLSGGFLTGREAAPSEREDALVPSPAPSRGPASAELARHLPTSVVPKLHGGGTNLFERIHRRIDERCQLGRLYDCR